MAITTEELFTMNEVEDMIEVAQKKLRKLKIDIADNEGLYAAAEKADKKDIKAATDQLKADEKKLKAQIDELEERHSKMRSDFTKNQTKERQEKLVANTLVNVVKTLNRLDAYYIVTEDLWYVTYLNTSKGRESKPIIKSYDSRRMGRTVEYLTDWEVPSDDALIKIAKDNNRCRLSIERTFLPEDPDVYNQMESIRSLWLEPKYDVEPDESFTLLLETITGNRKDYVEQLEKIIAYSYCHPEDLQVPNIDSIAIGGSGRGTLWKMVEIIFTDECCGSAKAETFSGTHNGDLWGKVWVRVSEQDSSKVDGEEFKNLTGSKMFRLRRMGKDAVDSPRTFRFFMETNKYGGTATYAGTGGSSSDRRSEPIVTTLTMHDHWMKHYNISLAEAEEKIHEIQDSIFESREKISEWLGHIIKKHDAYNMKGIRALHGECYKMVCERQTNTFATFMETVLELQITGNCFAVKDLHKVYKLATSKNIDQTRFASNIADYMTKKTRDQWEVRTVNCYDHLNTRHRKLVVIDSKLLSSKDGPKEDKALWDLTDFIDPDVPNPKKDGDTYGLVINIDTIKGELL